MKHRVEQPHLSDGELLTVKLDRLIKKNLSEYEHEIYESEIYEHGVYERELYEHEVHVYGVCLEVHCGPGCVQLRGDDIR